MPADTAIPKIGINSENVINIVIEQTDAFVEDQGYTYNEPGLTYNQAGVFYGGVQNVNEDVVPLIVTASQVIPNNVVVNDIYTPFVPPPLNPVMGVGWFMFVLHG
ncbi:MAG: hypothetical protein KGI08_10580 [Thaumarchaeota archaeon]|nr:hypothetical protein [Nitrososphaerota archaeon]